MVDYVIPTTTMLNQRHVRLPFDAVSYFILHGHVPLSSNFLTSQSIMIYNLYQACPYVYSMLSPLGLKCVLPLEFLADA